MTFGRKRKEGSGRQGNRSLAVQQFRMMVFFALVSGVLLLVIHIVLSIRYVMGDLQFSTAKTAAGGAYAIETLVHNPKEYSSKVLAAYREKAHATDEDASRATFEAITSEEGYKTLVKTIAASRPFGISEFYLAALDKDTQSVVLVADPVPEDGTAAAVGTAVKLPAGLIQSIISANAEDTSESLAIDPEDGLCAISVAPVVEDDPDAGYVVAVADEGGTLEGIVLFFVQYAVAMLIVLGIMWFIIDKRVNKTVVGPIEEISDAARAYRDDRLNGEFGMSHFSSLEIHTGNEVEDLSHVLADMETDLANYVVEYARLSVESEREKTELRMAAEIQRSALPDVFPAFPERTEFDMYASMTPAREVGGDFYDFFLVDNDHLCLVIADVSDKGVPAALFMMNCKTELANHVMMGKSPAEALRDTNATICVKNHARMFVTIWVGILQISTGMLIAANGGHEYPVLQRPHGRFSLYKDRHGLVVGGRQNTRYADYRIMLRPGSKLFVYTDGLPEATDSDERMFGLDRMVEVLNETKDAAPKEILNHMQRAVEEFVQGGEQFDDLTMLCLEYSGPRKEEDNDARDT